MELTGRPTTVPRLRPSLKGTAPGLAAERALWNSGVDTVVGLDEVGRGAWAGPLTVAAAVVPRDRRVYKIRDSKMLHEHERESLFDRVTEWVVAYGVGHVSHAECDELGMSDAQRLAAVRALEELGMRPDHHLIDGKWNFVASRAVSTIVRGDSSSLSIAAASIIAKVSRDRIMNGLAAHHPSFEFESNKGYPSPAHRAALHWCGPSTVHRRSWAFMDGLVYGGGRIRRPDDQLEFDLSGSSDLHHMPTP